MSTEHRLSVCEMFWVDVAFAFSRRLKEEHKWTLKTELLSKARKQVINT